MSAVGFTVFVLSIVCRKTVNIRPSRPLYHDEVDIDNSAKLRMQMSTVLVAGCHVLTPRTLESKINYIGNCKISVQRNMRVLLYSEPTSRTALMFTVCGPEREKLTFP